MRRRGFTLIELLVVLLILAATTTIAIRSTSRLAERSRFDRTQQILEDVATAVAGNAMGVALGEAQVNFCADMGRLPNVLPVAPDDLGRELRELWEPPLQPDGVTPVLQSAVRRHPLDPEIALQTGWRGPYLDLPVGADLLLDGHGAPLVPIFELLPGGALATWGLSSINDPGQPDDDLLTVLYQVDQVTGDVIRNRVFATLGGTVFMEENPSGLLVTVVVYGPDPETGGLLAVAKQATGVPDQPAYTYLFDESDGFVVGPRVVRAYVHTAGAAPQTAALKSAVHRVVLRPGGNTLDLQIEAGELPGPDIGGPGQASAAGSPYGGGG